jgi:hypothetical protein
MDLKAKKEMVAKAISAAGFEVTEIPDLLSSLAISYGVAVGRSNGPIDADTFVFMTLDKILERWQPIRSGMITQSAVVVPQCEAAGCTNPADFTVINGEERSRRCDPHAAQLRDALRDAGASAVRLERIPKG